jgi:hypothetical protein
MKLTGQESMCGTQRLRSASGGLGMIFVTLDHRTAGRTSGDVTRTPEFPYCGSS